MGNAAITAPSVLNSSVISASNFRSAKLSAAVSEMAAAVQEINEHCRETMINDGSCGVRELISWVQSYMVTGSILDAARFTVLSSASGDADNRADIFSTCLEQKFAA